MVHPTATHGDGPGAGEQQGAPPGAAGALGDERSGVRWVGSGGGEAVEDVAEVVVEPVVGGGEPVGGEGLAVGEQQPAPGGGHVADEVRPAASHHRGHLVDGDLPRS